MSRYNQPYSEIREMPYKDIIFFMALLEAEDVFTKEEIERRNREIKRKMRR